MKILKQREIVECAKHDHSFKWRDGEGGFSFPCDEKGNVYIEKLQPLAREHYEKCISGEYDVIDNGIEVYRWNYTEPAIGECMCGEEVELFGFTNTCESCERDYNMSGQLLASREYWGEETGESLSDILGVR